MWKYLLYGPFVAKVLYSRFHDQEDQSHEDSSWCLHLLIVCALRGLIHQLWSSYNNMLFLTRNRRILQQAVGFKQIDSEWDWYICFPVLKHRNDLILWFIKWVCFKLN